MPRGVVAQHATGTMSAVARSPDHATGPTEGLPLISPEETSGRRPGAVGRPRHSAVNFGNERSVLDWSSYP